MCLSSVRFALNHNGIGVGYKAVSIIYLDSLERLNWSSKCVRDNDWSKNWQEAKNKIDDGKVVLFTRDGSPYPIGFHILLSTRDAKLYSYSSQIWQVEYKEILAFGKQASVYTSKVLDCVIAKYMRFVKKVK